jgi:hypothetical protein
MRHIFHNINILHAYLSLPYLNPTFPLGVIGRTYARPDPFFGSRIAEDSTGRWTESNQPGGAECVSACRSSQA